MLQNTEHLQTGEKRGSKVSGDDDLQLKCILSTVWCYSLLHLPPISYHQMNKTNPAAEKSCSNWNGLHRNLWEFVANYFWGFNGAKNFSFSFWTSSTLTWQMKLLTVNTENNHTQEKVLGAQQFYGYIKLKWRMEQNLGTLLTRKIYFWFKDTS